MDGIVLEYGEDYAECGICQEPHHLNDIYMTGCHHRYCMSCFSHLLEEPHIRCPLCRDDIVVFTFRNRKRRIHSVHRGEEPEVPDLPEEYSVSGRRAAQVSGRRACVDFALAILTVGNLIWLGVYMSMAERCPNAG
jgi:hypothetical protein